jgi:hypothetical protein
MSAQKHHIDFAANNQLVNPAKLFYADVLPAKGTYRNLRVAVLAAKPKDTSCY